MSTVATTDDGTMPEESGDDAERERTRIDYGFRVRCESCGHNSTCVYRCEECGRDLTEGTVTEGHQEWAGEEVDP